MMIVEVKNHHGQNILKKSFKDGGKAAKWIEEMRATGIINRLDHIRVHEIKEQGNKKKIASFALSALIIAVAALFFIVRHK